MGLIEAIGDWVVEEVARQDACGAETGSAPRARIQPLPRQMWQPDLFAEDHGPAGGLRAWSRNVVVEITESTAMIDPDRTQAILHELHDRGLRLAIDDFGTGYSSLSRLKHMPVDILKIDRAFVRDVDKDRNAGSMVSAMIALAGSLA